MLLSLAAAKSSYTKEMWHILKHQFTRSDEFGGMGGCYYILLSVS
jgi:hypothetical protein